MCLSFAHRHPDRVQGLVIVGSTPSWVQRPDFPIGIPRRALEGLGEVWGTGIDIGSLDEIEVEVLGDGLGARGQRQPEAELRTRGEPFGVGHWKANSTHRPLPQTSAVSVAHEADLSELAVAETELHADAPASNVRSASWDARRPSVTGTSAVRDRS